MNDYIILERKVRDIENASTLDFVELVKIAGLNPETSFLGMDLSGIDFRNCDLSGYNFSNCFNVGKADFSNAKISKAIFDYDAIISSNLESAADFNDLISIIRNKNTSEVSQIITDSHERYIKINPSKKRSLISVYFEGTRNSPTAMFATAIANSLFKDLLVAKEVRNSEEEVDKFADAVLIEHKLDPKEALYIDSHFIIENMPNVYVTIGEVPHQDLHDLFQLDETFLNWPEPTSIQYHTRRTEILTNYDELFSGVYKIVSETFTYLLERIKP